MRTFSSGVRGALAKKHGLDPTMFIGIDWNGEEYFYSSHEFQGANQQIVAVAGLETTQVVDGTGASQSVTVTLSDTDGHIRTMLDTVDIQKRPAKLYMGFPGIPINQSVVLIDGEVNSEVVWNDRARTLTFTILNKIEGRQFGFAMEDGLFEEVNPQDRSKPWPFRFGSTCAYEATEVRNGVTGILRIGQGVLDATIDAKICQARQISCPKIESPLGSSDPGIDDFDGPTYARNQYLANMDEFGQVNGGSGQLEGFGFIQAFETSTANGVSNLEKSGLGTGVNGGYGFSPSGRPLVPDRECERAKFETLCQLLRSRANQLLYVNDTLQILDGDKFPQGRLTQIRIGDVTYEGTFSGETFTIEKTNRVDNPTGVVDCSQVGPLTQGYRNMNVLNPQTTAQCSTPSGDVELRVVGGAGEAWRKLGEIEDSKFIWLSAGSNVYLAEDAARVHVVSLVPGLVTGVYAYRKFGDTSQLTELPTTYYTVQQTNYGDLEAVEIHLTRGLESYPDENWDTTLYVHFESDIGPNPADVIQWIIENFTDYTIDATSFASVKTSLTNYPCNYYHAKKENVLDTVNRLAYEARCALTITDGVVKIKYLSKEPDADVTMTNADLVAGSFSFKHSRTENLVTSQDVTWQPFGADVLSTNEVPRKFTVERNVSKYGYFGNARFYESINNEEQALKTATFWNIRDSNTWRIVSFQTTLEHMNLELFDTINLNIPQFPNVKCVITGMEVNPTNGIIEFECWTPVLSGTTEEYFFAWPALKAQEPYPGDNFEVEEPLLSITPPIGHPLWVESASGQPPVAPTAGDRIPSDLDDTFPTTTCSDMNDSELVDTLEPEFEDFSFPVDTAQQATRADAIAADGLSWSFEEPEETVACGRPSLETCIYTVNVQYGTATSIAPSPNPGGGFNCGIKPGPCNTTERGKRCAGPSYFICRTFGSLNMALAFKGAIESQIERAHCSFRVGVTAPISATLLPIKGSNCPNIDAEVGSNA